MPEEIKEFRTPLDPNGNHWATLPTLHQSQQVNIPQGGLHRTASQHKPTHADAETGAVRYPAVNGSHPAGWAHESVPAPKQPSKIEIRWTNPVGQAPSSTNASLSMGRRTYSLSKPADSEFKAFSPTSRNTLPSDVSSRIADKYHPGNTKQAPPKIQLHYTAATKLLALLAESDDEYEDVFASRVEPPITKTNKSTPVQALRQKFDKDLDEPKKILAKSLLVRSENPQIHGKPKTVATEKPPEMQLLPRVIYKLARTQTSGTPENKGASLQEPCSHKHEYAESKPYQPTGFQLPENYSTSTPAGRSSLNTKTNGDFHAQKSSYVGRAPYISTSFW